MKQLIKHGYLSFVFVLLYLPILVLIAYSFNDAHFSLSWHGFTINWYHILFQDEDLWSALINSMLLGFGAASIASLFAFIVCVHLFLQSQTKSSNFLHSTLLMMIILPDIVLGISLLVFFNLAHIKLGFTSLFIAHITFCIPFAIIVIQSRISTLNVDTYHSAIDLGASKLRAMTHIILPMLWPAVLSAFLLCFTLSFDDVIISYFVSGPDFNILPLYIFSLVRMGVTPELNALCSITIGLSMLLVLGAHMLSKKETI